MVVVEYYRLDSGRRRIWRIKVKARNGVTLMQSRWFRDKTECMNALRSLSLNFKAWTYKEVEWKVPKWK